MEFGYQTQGAWAQLTEAVAWAESTGAMAFALPDHYYMAEGTPMYDAPTQFGALAATTDSIELACLASPVTFRHPSVLAKAAATINDIAPGRFVLGVGSGWFEREHDVFGLWFGTFTERFEVLEEQLQYITTALGKAGGGYRGERYRLEDVDIHPQASEVRLLVGGTGSHKTPRLAGRYAGEFNVYPGADMAERIDRMKSAAADAGRDPDEIMITSSGAVCVAPTRVEYEKKFARLAEVYGMTVDGLEAHFTKRNTPRGDVDEVAEQLAAVAAVGVTRFYVQALGGFVEEEATATWEMIGA